MVYFWYVLFGTISVYSATILYFSFHWSKKDRNSGNSPGSKTKLPSISVIVAYRNEAKHLNTLISSLSCLDYPTELFELILIDDHSEDASYSMVLQQAKNSKNLKALQLPNDLTGKKEALNFGISKAKGELLSFTDADCVVPQTWLKSLATFYLLHYRPEMVIGLVDLCAPGWLQKVFRLEFLSLIISGAGAAKAGIPFMCNGANLAVKASALKSFKHNATIASGDDMFLLHSLKKQKAGILLLKSREHLVKTRAPLAFKDFFLQRRRWTSKSLRYTDKNAIAVAMMVFLSNSLLAASLLTGFLSGSLALAACAFLVKMSVDFILFLSAKDFFSYREILWWYPFMAIVYPFYIFFTPFSAIKRPFSWKGRTFKV
jgi:biofilm PGA synthesis N-glycosyltransferase PgaC